MHQRYFRCVSYLVEVTPPAAPKSRTRLFLTRNGSFVRNAPRNEHKFVRFSSYGAARNRIFDLSYRGHPLSYLRVQSVDDYATEFRDY